MELGRSGGTACPLVVETPPTPSALLMTKESGARLSWATSPATQHPLKLPLPFSIDHNKPCSCDPEPLNPSSHRDKWLETPLNFPPPRPSPT